MPKKNNAAQKQAPVRQAQKSKTVPKRPQSAPASKSKPQRQVAKKVTTAPQPKKLQMRVPKSQGIVSESPGVFSTLGNGIGSLFGKEGADIGRGLGSLFGRITGMGDYKISHNTLLSGPPMFKNDGSTVLSHREFLCDLVGSTTFAISAYPLNPGNATVFPWLSQLAQMYDQYQMLGIVFEFKSTSSDATNTTNTALGTVIMTTSYDPVDPQFTGKQQMEAYEYTTSCKPSESMLHAIECAPSQNTLKNLYVRSNVVPSGADKHFYDVGTLYVATTGMQTGGYTIGELWVSYHVKLMRPKLPTPLNSDILSWSGTGIPAQSFGPLASAVGVAMTPDANVTLAVSFDLTDLANQRFTISVPGRYLVVYERCYPSGATTTQLTGVTAYGTGSIVPGFTFYNTNVAGSTGTGCWVLDVLNPGDGLIFPNVISSTGGDMESWLRITQWNGGLASDKDLALRRPSVDDIDYKAYALELQRQLHAGDDGETNAPAARSNEIIEAGRSITLPSYRQLKNVSGAPRL